MIIKKKQEKEEEQPKLLHFPEDYILAYDKEGMKRDIMGFPKSIVDGYSLGQEVKLDTLGKAPISRIIFTGMGGSAISGDIFRMLLGKQGIPVFVNRGYDLPLFTDKNSLVFVQSYSGNTEETISAFRQAIRIGCRIIVIASGGRIEKMAQGLRIPVVKVPAGHQPRAALGYMFFSALKVLEKIGVVPDQSAEVEKLVKSLAGTGSIEKTAIDLSGKLIGKIPLIYASSEYYPIALRWKTQINENAKVMAFSNEFSELDHNEIVGFTNLSAKFHVILLNFSDYSRRMIKRIGITKRLMQKKGVDAAEIGISGSSFLVKIFTAIMIGDLLSYYLSLRYRQDPSPVEIIENLKKDMGPFV